ncbi:MAG: hypothetical protein RIG62_31410 [Cyclobacteriaceae bacterium]|jgi:hypothetical protein
MRKVKKMLRRIGTFCLILLTCVALGLGLPIIPEMRYTYQDREVKTELVERREDEGNLEENEQRE